MLVPFSNCHPEASRDPVAQCDSSSESRTPASDDPDERLSTNYVVLQSWLGRRGMTAVKNPEYTRVFRAFYVFRHPDEGRTQGSTIYWFVSISSSSTLISISNPGFALRRQCFSWHILRGLRKTAKGHLHSDLSLPSHSSLSSKYSFSCRYETSPASQHPIYTTYYCTSA
jgi:hypothetical protein